MVILRPPKHILCTVLPGNMTTEHFLAMREVTLETKNFATQSTVQMGPLASYLAAFALAVEGWGDLVEEEVMDTISNEGEEEEDRG